MCVLTQIGHIVLHHHNVQRRGGQVRGRREQVHLPSLRSPDDRVVRIQCLQLLVQIADLVRHGLAVQILRHAIVADVPSQQGRMIPKRFHRSCDDGPHVLVIGIVHKLFELRVQVEHDTNARTMRPIQVVPDEGVGHPLVRHLGAVAGQIPHVPCVPGLSLPCQIRRPDGLAVIIARADDGFTIHQKGLAGVVHLDKRRSLRRRFDAGKE
mmetsp:Transcript_56798/g.164514  ORF Transcript_56798/g.164514 Transcript_56798/m.164514 type:complete len:210 (+) Transcript_56798:871-1500(+)